MKENNKIIIAIAVLVCVGAAWYFVSHQKTTPVVTHKTFKQPLSRVETPEGKAVEAFYKDYLSSYNTSKERHDMDFSKSFSEAIQKNKARCKGSTAKNCLFGTERDVYLNSIPKDVDPKLNFDNAEFRTTEPQHGSINISLNVYPSRPNQEKFYHRYQQFKMIDEDGKWVVDDILLDGISSKKIIAGDSKTTY